MYTSVASVHLSETFRNVPVLKFLRITLIALVGGHLGLDLLTCASCDIFSMYNIYIYLYTDTIFTHIYHGIVQ